MHVAFSAGIFAGHARQLSQTLPSEGYLGAVSDPAIWELSCAIREAASGEPRGGFGIVAGDGADIRQGRRRGRR